jgi:hypothetical protein
LTETAEIEIAPRQRDDPERLRGRDKNKNIQQAGFPDGHPL